MDQLDAQAPMMAGTLAPRPGGAGLEAREARAVLDGGWEQYSTRSSLDPAGVGPLAGGGVVFPVGCFAFPVGGVLRTCCALRIPLAVLGGVLFL